MISSKTSMENYKTLKFDSNLVPKILSGDKTSTWRLFDDKDLKVGDNLILIEKETGKEFAKAVITEVEDREIQNIRESDYKGHDKFESKEAALEAFKKHYGLSVTPTSVLKIVRFKLEENELKMVKKFRNPTKEADDLKKALEDK